MNVSQTPIVRDLESVFVLIFSDLHPLPPSDSKLYYDSYTKELVVADLIKGSVKHLDMSDSDENNLKQKLRENDIFSTKRTYYTKKMDMGSKRLLIILDSKFHTVDIDVYDPNATESNIPQGLLNILDIMNNMLSK
jgi:hypothetical protein